MIYSTCRVVYVCACVCVPEGPSAGRSGPFLLSILFRLSLCHEITGERRVRWKWGMRSV